jgi:hypothetical protein
MYAPPAWTPPLPEIKELQALVRRLEILDEMRVMEENRLGSGDLSDAVRSSLEEHVAYLHEQIRKTRRQIKELQNQRAHR